METVRKLGLGEAGLLNQAEGCNLTCVEVHPLPLAVNRVFAPEIEILKC